MKIEKDYEELLRLFNRYKVKYCIVGAYAVAFYGKPRYTKDMDILVEPDIENSRRIVKALGDFGFGGLKISAEDFAKKNNIIQLGYEPLRVDIVTSLSGCTFAEVWKNKVKGNYGTAKVFFIGREELIKNKKKTNRQLDKADIDVLSGVNKRRK